MNRAKRTKGRPVEDVPLPGTESLIPDTNGPTAHFLMITVKRRDLVRAMAAYDRAVWKAHKAGITHKLIAQASDINEASVRDRLRRLRRQAAERAAEFES